MSRLSLLSLFFFCLLFSLDNVYQKRLKVTDGFVSIKCENTALLFYFRVADI